MKVNKETNKVNKETNKVKCQFCTMTQKKDPKTGQLIWVHDYNNAHPPLNNVRDNMAGIKSYMQEDDRYKPKIKGL